MKKLLTFTGIVFFILFSAFIRSEDRYAPDPGIKFIQPGDTVTCGDCNGAGNVICSKCGGSKREAREENCTKCGGNGKSACMNCSGGYIRCTYCSDGTLYRNCGTCYGTGRNNNETCGTCSGKGKIPETCSNCSGTGKVCHSYCNCSGQVECTLCSGTGKKTWYYPCSGCGERGYVSCNRCGGRGYLVR